MIDSFFKRCILPVSIYLRRLSGIDGLRATLNTVAYQQGFATLRDLLAEERCQDPKRLLKFGYCAFSQNDEDRIIKEIFKRVGTKTKRFLEIDAGLCGDPHSLIRASPFNLSFRSFNAASGAINILGLWHRKYWRIELKGEFTV